MISSLEKETEKLKEMDDSSESESQKENELQTNSMIVLSVFVTWIQAYEFFLLFGLMGIIFFINNKFYENVNSKSCAIYLNILYIYFYKYSTKAIGN